MNFGLRLDEIINSAYEGEISWIHDQLDGISVMDDAIKRIEDEKAKTKQAITSLIKELIEQAKPPYSPVIANPDTTEEAIAKSIATYGNKQIDRYKTNLKDLLK